MNQNLFQYLIAVISNKKEFKPSLNDIENVADKISGEYYNILSKFKKLAWKTWLYVNEYKSDKS